MYPFADPFAHSFAIQCNSRSGRPRYYVGPGPHRFCGDLLRIYSYSYSCFPVYITLSPPTSPRETSTIRQPSLTFLRFSWFPLVPKRFYSHQWCEPKTTCPPTLSAIPWIFVCSEHRRDSARGLMQQSHSHVVPIYI